MDNPSDIFSLCRLCLVKDQVNISIFDEQGDIRQIFLKISSCLPIKVSRDDKLPKKICDDCSNKLDLLYEFWNSSANAEKTLLSWLGQAGVKDAGGTINAVAQQIAKPTETLVKLESGVVEGNSVLISPCVNNVDNESFNELPKEESEAAPPPPKRTRRSAAVKAQINIIPESEDDDDIDTTDLPTKLEDGPEDSDAEDKDPSYTEVPGTSANDQPGPSGVGKAGGVEAPKRSTRSAKKIYTKKKIIIKCKRCKEIFKNLNQLKEHKKIHLSFSYALLEDEEPNYKFDNIQDLFICSTCSAEFQEKAEAEVHINIHKSLIKCTICSKAFKNYFDLGMHSSIHDSNRNVKCPLCSYTSTNPSPSSFKAHINFVHLKQFPFYCKECGRGFKHFKTFEEHQNTHVGKKPYVCVVCEKGFIYQKYLHVHQLRNHQVGTTGKKIENECRTCNRYFYKPEALTKHIKVCYKKNKKPKNDSPAKAFLCDECGQTFTEKAKLLEHLRVHKGEFPFVCTWCGKRFPVKSYLKTHERVHTGEKPYSCEFCGKRFAQHAPFRVHRRMHTGERPYVCEFCNKGFTTNQALKFHKKNCPDNQINRLNQN